MSPFYLSISPENIFCSILHVFFVVEMKGKKTKRDFVFSPHDSRFLIQMFFCTKTGFFVKKEDLPHFHETFFFILPFSFLCFLIYPSEGMVLFKQTI